jgi:hypothetical protein
LHRGGPAEQDRRHELLLTEPGACDTVWQEVIILITLVLTVTVVAGARDVTP